MFSLRIHKRSFKIFTNQPRQPATFWQERTQPYSLVSTDWKKNQIILSEIRFLWNPNSWMAKRHIPDAGRWDQEDGAMLPNCRIQLLCVKSQRIRTTVLWLLRVQVWWIACWWPFLHRERLFWNAVFVLFRFTTINFYIKNIYYVSRQTLVRSMT